MMRVVAFPLRMGRRWAFQVLPSPSPEASRAAAAPAAGFGGAMAVFRELINRIDAAPNTSARFNIMVRFGEDQMQYRWVELGAAPPGTIRHKIYSLGRKLLSKLEPSEQFFKAIPQDAMNINIIHPTSVNSRLARRRLRHLAISGIVFHRRLLYGSIALLPFSALFAIIPFPNVVIGWNFFRAHAHWRALQGSRKLLELVTEKGEKQAKGVSLRSFDYTPSEKLEKLVNRANESSEPLSNEKIEAICKEYQLDSMDVTKWRDHTSKMLKLAWA